VEGIAKWMHLAHWKSVPVAKVLEKDMLLLACFVTLKACTVCSIAYENKLNLIDIANKIKLELKTHLLMQPCYFNMLPQV